MEQDCEEAEILLMLGLLMVFHGFQIILMNTMCAVTILSNRILTDRSYALDFHHKRRHLREMVYKCDTTCYNNIRMYRATFDKLCGMLDTIGGLKPTKHMLVDEQVAIFLHILAHHQKNRVVQFEFGRSGETISRYFTGVLRAMMLIQKELFKTPEPIPENSTDKRWKWFKVTFFNFYFVIDLCDIVWQLIIPFNAGLSGRTGWYTHKGSSTSFCKA